MIWWIYNFIFPIVFLFLLPHYLMRMLRRGGYARDFSQRFGCYGRAESELLDAPGQPIWIQAVSVGELSIALSFMDELRRREPGIRFVLTTNTSTGHALALQKVHAPDVTLYFPMDVPLVMRRALRRIRPAIVVLIENEMWPNLIRTAEKRGIPTIMVNGRISENSFKGYRKIRFITRDLLPRIRWFCVQSAADRDRLLYLGAPPEKVEITGSAKYDLPATPPTVGSTKPCINFCSEPGKMNVSESTHTMNSPRPSSTPTAHALHKPRFFAKLTTTRLGWCVCAASISCNVLSLDPSSTQTTSRFSFG
jgi:3-deoxy-D-manno-octulosonic-acid transferase